MSDYFYSLATILKRWYCDIHGVRYEDTIGFFAFEYEENQ